MLASHGPGTRSLHATRAGQTGLAGLSPRHLVHCLPVRASPRRVLASRWVGLGESSARLTIVRSRRRSGGARRGGGRETYAEYELWSGVEHLGAHWQRGLRVSGERDGESLCCSALTSPATEPPSDALTRGLRDREWQLESPDTLDSPRPPNCSLVRTSKELLLLLVDPLLLPRSPIRTQVNSCSTSQAE